jgi:hypothetical protein
MYQPPAPSTGIEVGRPSTPIMGQAAPPQYPDINTQPNGREVQAAAMGPPAVEAVPMQPMPPQPMPAQQAPTVPASLFEPAQPHMHAPAPTPAAPVAAVRPPNVKVAFEVRGMPFKQEAYFHQVIRKDGNLVLVYDTRAEGYTKTFPQPIDQDLAVYVDGNASVYVTATTGIQFNLDDNEVCVLLIKDEKPLPQ